MPNYGSMLATLKSDMQRYIAERDTAQEKVQRIAAAIEHIQILAQELDAVSVPAMEFDEDQGFTGRVREILKTNAPKRLTALDIRDVLLAASPNDDPKVMLIHTHNTLKRLHSQGEVDETQIADSRKAYQWKDKDLEAAVTALDVLSASPIMKITRRLKKLTPLE